MSHPAGSSEGDPSPARLAEDLLWLIDIPSETGDEAALCTAIGERLSGVVDVEMVGGSLVAGRRSGRPRIDLYGHLDTVPVNGNLPGRIEADRVHGLGASDMKAGLALMLAALEDPAVADGPYDVMGVFYDREEGPADENGLEEVLNDVDHLADPVLALVMEPTDNELQLGCQGTVNATVTFSGEAAHSARPWLGVNAVTRAGDWLQAMHERAARDVVVDGLTFKETFAVTTARGGRARNVIPDSFEVNLNHRYPPGRTEADVTRLLEEVCEPADSVEIIDHAPAAPILRDHAEVRRLEATGVVVTAKTAWTDVARLAQRGIPAVNLGPGEVALAHRADESVAISALERGWEILSGYLRS